MMILGCGSYFTRFESKYVFLVGRCRNSCFLTFASWWFLFLLFEVLSDDRLNRQGRKLYFSEAKLDREICRGV